MMTTTEHFQSKPEYYSSKEECEASKGKYINSNPRYRNFNQTVFHAGDVEQFETYRDPTNGEVCIPRISLAENIFESKLPLLEPGLTWNGYQEIPATCVDTTFRYIFDKFKKGIFVKIQGNRLRVLLPFSKVNFVNEWGSLIKVDPKKYHDLNDFFKKVSREEGRPFNPSRVNKFPGTWYGNNCLVRSEFPINEGDTGVTQVKDMFRELCKSRQVPDMEFFVNRRDYPLLKRDYTEPYEHIYNNDSLPLVSHRHEKYSPILSNVTGERFADVPIPTPEDWSRVSRADGKYFTKDCKEYDDKFDTPWEDKKPVAVFRGSSTGCGVTVETNPRLKAAWLSNKGEKDKDGLPLLDAGITKWSARPRKIKGNPYLTALDVESLGFGLSSQLTPREQSEYKYIINIDGHVSAFRLSLELATRSVVLKVDSPFKMWFSPLLVPNRHYIPVKEDLSDLIEKIRWCKAHDKECKIIAKNARDFYEKYLSKDGVLDYLQVVLAGLRKETGVYLYNYKSPLVLQIDEELALVRRKYFPPGAEGTVKSMPPYERTFAFLQGTHWVFNYLLRGAKSSKDLNSTLPVSKLLCQNTHSRVNLRSFFGANMIIGKEPTLREKLRESIHEAFVGLYGVNNVVKEAPNFVYTFGAVEYEDHLEILQEYVPGISFFDYLKSKMFRVQEYIFILIQLCAALEVAQNVCGFVHYDLFPWNIVLKFNEPGRPPQVFDYSLGKNKVLRIKTSVVPHILDYGKSGVIYRGRHHGFIKPYKVSRIQDTVSILVSSLHVILNNRTVSQEDFSSLLKLSNFLSGTGFNKTPFGRSKELKEFLAREHKFSVMLESDKHELENRTPMDLVRYIQKTLNFSYPVSERRFCENTLNRGNGRQIFDFYFAGTVPEKIKSYTDVFLRLKKCSIPQPKNVIHSYFAIQRFYDNLTGVYSELLRFLNHVRHGNINAYKRLYEDSINFLNFVYTKSLEKEPATLNITVDESFRDVVPAPYSQETFLLPGKIAQLLNVRGELPDLALQRELLVSVFNDGGKYKLPEGAYNFYSSDLADLFKASPLALLNNYANVQTIVTVSRGVYGNDLEALSERVGTVPASQCEDDFEAAKEYMSLYQEILEAL